ncbi:MAG: hypothetical protein ABIR24_04435 [Verrucomicrobiota bacterium]
MKTTINDSARRHSPFWALTAVFLTLVFLQGMDLISLLEQRSRLQTTLADFHKIMPQAVIINKTVENLGRDLLAMTNQEARQIIADFKIAGNPGK